MIANIIKIMLTVAAVATFAFVPNTEKEQTQNATAPVQYMQVDPGGTGG